MECPIDHVKYNGVESYSKEELQLAYVTIFGNKSNRNVQIVLDDLMKTSNYHVNCVSLDTNDHYFQLGMKMIISHIKDELHKIHTNETPTLSLED